MTDLSAVIPSLPAARRIEMLSKPIFVLLSIALGLLFVVGIPQIFALLFLFHGETQGWVSSSAFGLELTVAKTAAAAVPNGALLNALGTGQRIYLSLLVAANLACAALMLLHARHLFDLYARGTVFAKANARHLKLFALWLALSKISINLSGKLFETITDVHSNGAANAVMAVVLATMIYVIASVMELAAEADQERREFI